MIVTFFSFCTSEDTSWKMLYLLYIELKLTSLKFLFIVPSGIVKNIIFTWQLYKNWKITLMCLLSHFFAWMNMVRMNNPADNSVSWFPKLSFLIICWFKTLLLEQWMTNISREILKTIPKSFHFIRSGAGLDLSIFLKISAMIVICKLS